MLNSRSKEKEAERLYNYYLKKKVYPLIGDKTTYLSQLLGAGKKLLGVKFKGVFPSDKIPKLNDLAPYSIINLDRSDQPGSHWISLAKIGDNTIVYDSFGRDYKKIIPSLKFSGNERIKNTDRDPEQRIEQTDCGARCLSWIMVLDKHGEDLAMKI